MRRDLFERFRAQLAPAGHEEQRPVAGLGIDDELPGLPSLDHRADLRAHFAVDVDELRLRPDRAKEGEAKGGSRGTSQETRRRGRRRSVSITSGVPSSAVNRCDSNPRARGCSESIDSITASIDSSIVYTLGDFASASNSDGIP